MALKERTCKSCHDKYMPIKPAQPRCVECTYALKRKKEVEQQIKQAISGVKEKRKAKVAKRKADKDRVKTRTQHYNELQTLVNRCVKLRDKNEPCCTCGTTNPNIKYDAGHFIAIKRGGVDPRRFELTNIHKQCSVNCNQYGSGMRAEYMVFITNKYGADHLEWLIGDVNHMSLKLRFPNIEDIQREKVKFRKMIKELT